MKKVLTVLLLSFVALSLMFVIFKEVRASKSTTDGVTAKEYKKLSDKPGDADLAAMHGPDADIVCYFMNNQRCTSCYRIQTYAMEAVETNFADDLDGKRLIWEVFNVDEPENRHFIKDFGLYTKSVVLVKIRDGKQVEYKNLDMVWSLLGEEEAFKEYIAREVRQFTGAKG